MTTTTRAAVLWERGEPWSIEDVELDEPRANDVLVRMHAAGMCHSDDHANTGDLPIPLPVIGGHEGAGVVEAIGPDVKGLAVGDHVAVSFVPACGTCRWCSSGQSVHLRQRGQALRHRDDERRARGPPRHPRRAAPGHRPLRPGRHLLRAHPRERGVAHQGRRRPALRRGRPGLLWRGHRLRLRHRAGGHQARRQRGRDRRRRHRHQRRAGRPGRRRPADHRHRPGGVQAGAGHGAGRHPRLRLHRGGHRRGRVADRGRDVRAGHPVAPASCTAR